MNKIFLRIFTAVMMFVLLSTSVFSAAASNPPALATDQLVNLVYFYKPPDNRDANTVAKHFSTYIFTRGDEEFRDALIAAGEKSPVMQYLRFEAIMNPGSCTAKPWKNQVAYQAGDFCNIAKNHPNWFLTDTNGNHIIVDGNFHMMDAGNKEWQAFWLSRAKTMQQEYGWKGIFLDNVEGSLGKIERKGVVPARYKSDADYQNAVRDFLINIYTNYTQPQAIPLMANIIHLDSVNTWMSYLQYLDGAMEEGWGVDWSNGYYSASFWEENLRIAEQTQAAGKYAILVSQGQQNDAARQRFAFASYLLINHGRAAFRYTYHQNYHEVWLYDNYQTQLGTALGARYQQGTSWRRDFSNGSVIVDPVNRTAEIRLSSSTPAAPTPQPPSHGSRFADVPASNPGWKYIESIFANGITSGCTKQPLAFCPQQNVTRAQMAVFILRSMHGKDYQPPQASGVFSDAPFSSPFTSWIEQAAAQGIAPECASKKFCPNQAITRKEMAYWLLRAKYGANYSPPPTSGLFNDLAANDQATRWIEKLYADAITSGCSTAPLNYCPNSTVTRWQMAVFLTKTFNLALP